MVLSAWHGLHLKKLPKLVGLVLRVQFLRADGTPRYQRPMWLFWTGPETVALKDLCCLYLWRFAIEHFFRFAKQQLGLNANQSTQTVSTDHWMWLCALVFWQLLFPALPQPADPRNYIKPIRARPWRNLLPLCESTLPPIAGTFPIVTTLWQVGYADCAAQRLNQFWTTHVRYFHSSFTLRAAFQFTGSEYNSRRVFMVLSFSQCECAMETLSFQAFS